MKKLVIDFQKDAVVAVAIDKGSIKDIFCVAYNNVVGNVYVGRVENIRGGVYFVKYKENCDNGIMKIGKSKLKVGDFVRCQVQREGIADKGAVLTTEITLAGQHVILAEDICGYKFSHKLQSSEIAGLKANLPTNSKVGFIIRSNAVGVDVDKIAVEINKLAIQYDNLHQNQNKIKCIYNQSIIDKIINELEAFDFPIITNMKKERGYMSSYPYTVYDNLLPILDYYGLMEKVEKLFDRKITLKEGIEIVFDYAEAMTVIDINSKANFRQPSEINKLAVTETAQQIRWRNLSGMIMIDFIGQKDSYLLRNYMEKELKFDKVRSKMSVLDDYSIVAINRQKKYCPYFMLFYEKCDRCDSGWQKKVSLQCKNICYELIRLYVNMPFDNILVKIEERMYEEFLSSAEYYLEKIANKAKVYIKLDKQSMQAYSFVCTNNEKDIEGACLLSN